MAELLADEAALDAYLMDSVVGVWHASGHLPDGRRRRSDGGDRCRGRCAGRREPSRLRRLDLPDDPLRQHQRAGDHGSRENRRFDPWPTRRRRHDAEPRHRRGRGRRALGARGTRAPSSGAALPAPSTVTCSGRGPAAAETALREIATAAGPVESVVAGVTGMTAPTPESALFSALVTEILGAARVSAMSDTRSPFVAPSRLARESSSMREPAPPPRMWRRMAA